MPHRGISIQTQIQLTEIFGVSLELGTYVMQNSDRLLDVFESLFGEEAVGLSNEDGMHSVTAWDSAGHLNLIMAIEAEYGLQFDPADFAELTSIGEIRRRIASLQG